MPVDQNVNPTPGDDGQVATDNATATDGPVRTGRGRRIVGGLVVVALLMGAGWVILPDAVPGFLDALRRNPLAPLLVGTFWLLATAASITGKRIIAARHLCWASTTTAHVGGTVANRLVPAGIGSTGVFVAALRRGGASTAAAAGVVALWAAAGALAHGGGLLIGVAWVHGGHAAVAGLAGVGVVATAGVVAARRAGVGVADLPWWLRWRERRRMHQRPEGDARRATTRQGVIGGVVRKLAGGLADVRAGIVDVVCAVRDRPLIGVAALVAQLVAIFSLAMGFATAAAAFGLPVSVVGALAAYLAGTALSAATPTPAGIGSAEAALVGALVVSGASVGDAVPTVLMYRAVVLLAPVVVAAVIAAAWLVKRVVCGHGVVAPWRTSLFRSHHDDDGDAITARPLLPPGHRQTTPGTWPRDGAPEGSIP